MKLKLFGLSLAVLVLIGAGCGSIAKTTSFKKPDIKDDFCGVHINFQYCKCAFHNDYCDTVGLSRSAANSYVRTEYNNWLNEELEKFKDNCRISGGAINGNKCHICADGYHAENNRCVNTEGSNDESNPADNEESEALTFQPDGPLNNDCSLKQEEFDADWRKYSDIDELIEFSSRSWEAQQTASAYDELIAEMINSFELERDLEIEKATLAELETYKEALVKNIKTNLLKSFWRLAWITYSTIDSGSGVGKSYASILEKGVVAETIGAGLKVIQASIPSGSTLAIDTSTTGGKAVSVGVNTALEAIDSLGDPKKVATEFIKSSTMATMPSADITPEEVEILRTQHLKNGALDESIRQSKETIEAYEGMLMLAEQEINRLQAEADSWEAKEKERVASMLKQSCLDLKNRFEEENQL